MLLLKKVNVNLRPLAAKTNMPTALKTAILPGDSIERLFFATQIGEIYYIGDGVIIPFVDLRSRIIQLGYSGGNYDERGLVGFAFHPQFSHNGLFYVHYSIAGSQGPGASHKKPNPCEPQTLNQTWENREINYDHIDTVEEWLYQSSTQSQKRRTLLNIRRPFFNHNGVNSLNFSPETKKLVLTVGDGGSGYDPFNLSQNNMEIAGKIIEIDIEKDTNSDNPPVVTRFDELPKSIQDMLTVIAKGTRNITGISFQKHNNEYIKYVGIVGQDLVESIYSFDKYLPIPVPQLIQASLTDSEPDSEEFINFGWRGWEGVFPTSIIRECSANQTFDEETITYYNEAVTTSTKRIFPLISYFHKDSRPDKFGATALTGVASYLGNGIPDLTGSVVFTDFARNEGSMPPVRGVLAYTKKGTTCKLNDFSVIETNYNFGSQAAYYTSLGTNSDQTRLYLGVYGSMNVTDFNQGTIFEIVP